jgi:DNA polymerase-1
VASYIFDIETNGIEDFRGLTDLHTIHCIITQDIETGEVFRWNSQAGSILTGVGQLWDADLLVGQNIMGFDIPAIQKLYPWFKPQGQVRDTKVCTRLIWPSDILSVKDYANKKFPARLNGKHSLEAWGHRLGEYKGAKQDFSQWSQELEDYCVQDVNVTLTLWKLIVRQNYSETAIQLEHDVQEIIFRQEQTGVPFNEAEAHKLYASLVQTRLEAEKELAGLFAPWYQGGSLFTPKRDDPYHKWVTKKDGTKVMLKPKKGKGYVAGAEMQHIKLVEFNPGSRDHIADRLIKLRGWKPKAFTADGGAQVDEKILSSLPYPEAKKLTRYLLIQKRIGQLAEGKKALMKFVKNGRIHGEVMTNGTVTGRAAHMNPNLGQVPKVQKGKRGEEGLWGFEFRNLFYAPEGWVMVGIDASGLELRMLGSRMAAWDGGAYAKEVVEGDVHTLHATALAIERDLSKTWTYAFLYGAGDKKLGNILKAKNAPSAGRQSRAIFQHKLPALGYLVNAVKRRHNTRKYLVGLDGRHVATRSEHSALNTLLQCDGSLVVKFWMVKLDRALTARGWKWGVDYAQILYVHDELQFLARPSIADELGCIAVETIRQVGKDLNLRVPLDATAHIGNTWATTH